MPAKGNVSVWLSPDQAMVAARWLRENYTPNNIADMPPNWETHQRELAHELSEKLFKASSRKRRGATFNLVIPRKYAQWFGAFYKPGGWWHFDPNVLLPGQKCPKQIRPIAGLFLKAASRTKGRPRWTLEETKVRHHCLAKISDERVSRQRRKKIRDLEWEREQIAAQDEEPELP